jgi:hypothetical protein
MLRNVVIASSAFAASAGAGALLSSQPAEACPGYAVDYGCSRCWCLSGQGCIGYCNEPPPNTCGNCDFGGFMSGCCNGFSCTSADYCDGGGSGSGSSGGY